MESDNDISDERIDVLLRDVAVPAELKSQLKQIATQSNFKTELMPKSLDPNTPSESRLPWLAFVLAASLIGLGLFVASLFWHESEEKPIVKSTPTTDSKIAHNSDPPQPVKVTESTKLTDALAMFLDEQEHLDAAIHAIEITRMEARLAETERNASIQLDQRETESIIAAMSEQYSIPLGMPVIEVKSRMAQVIERYPGTQGAEIAQEFLNQSNN